MTEREICYSYRSAKHKEKQIQILAELNDVNSLEIIKILVRGREKLSDSVIKPLFKRLDMLDGRISMMESEYREIAEALKGGMMDNG